MKKSILTILQYLFFLGLGILFVWLTIKDINHEQWQHIKLSIQNARHWIIVPVFAMLLLSHYSRALRWKILMEPLGYTPTTFNTFAAVMIGYLVNAGVPRLGEVIKCTLLARYENVRVDKLVGTIVVERAIDVVCLLVVFILALIFQGHAIGTYTIDLFKSFFQDNAGQFSTQRLIFFFSGLILFISLSYYLLKRFGHIDAVAKIKKVITGVFLGLNSIRLIKHKGLFAFHTFLIWAMYLMSTTAGIYALRETEHLGIGAGLATLGIGSIGMIATPGGIGAYPFLVAKLMFLYHIPEETGTALGWLLWSAQTIIILFGGIILAGLFSFFIIKTGKPLRTGNIIFNKVLSIEQLQKRLAQWRLIGKTVSFTNGCFDILHEGHIASLTEAAYHADILIIGLNSDASIKRLKGASRPINNEHSRALILASLCMVDAVVVFSEDTPLDLIVAIQPDFLVKGGDYKVEEIAGAKEVLEAGGKVIINPIVEGFSTTGLIQKMQESK